jgi:hypothetical protein
MLLPLRETAGPGPLRSFRTLPSQCVVRRAPPFPRSEDQSIRFSTFPRTEPPPLWAAQILEIFRRHEGAIGTVSLDKGLKSDAVLEVLAADLQSIGFLVESGKGAGATLERPVFFGENGAPVLRYHVDGYHPTWRCGLEIEAGRAWMGNAVYRDLVQALVMVDVDWLCLAVSNGYRYKNAGKAVVSKDYENARDLADAIFGHTRVRLPYRLLLIGY